MQTSRALQIALAAVAMLVSNRALAGDRGPRMAMGLVSAAYVVNAACGAHLAIRDDLHETPFGMHSNRAVRTEFYRGTGTAFSPGLPMLLTQVVSTVLALQDGGTARAGSLSLAIHGGGYLIGGLAEPETYRVLAHPQRAGLAKVAVVMGEIVIPPVLVIEAAQVRRRN